jgi:hypothetical protein
MIPSTGTTLMFGRSGVGKTVLAWNLLNAVAAGQTFLGRKTTPCAGMFLSMDTPRPMVIDRWIANNPQFHPAFEFAAYQGSFDCLDPLFDQSQLYQDVQNAIQEKRDPVTGALLRPKIQLVFVDALRNVFNGEMNDDNMPYKVYESFQSWFQGAAVVFIHHTRKAQVFQGKVVEGNVDDEATGTKYWVNTAQVALSLKMYNESVLKLQMGKSQCFGQWDEPIKAELNGSFVTPWTKAQAGHYSQTYSTALAHLSANDPSWSAYTITEKDEAMATHLGVVARTIRKYRSAYLKQIP